MSVWKLPPRIKVYEALGCIADERIRVTDTTAAVQSSQGTKTYTVTFDPEKNMISSNDNGSYWQGYLGYPGLAFLMVQKILPFDPTLAQVLKGIAWKELNTSFHNNWEKTEEWIYMHKGHQDELEQFAKTVLVSLESIKVCKPTTRKRPVK
jgi:hypothetical protein